ncbi:MAG: uncharacterized protein QOC79_1317, partial [Actinomycetota bacterium]|nr:uncharacterized protein [Actinomycetota bacterium]
ADLARLDEVARGKVPKQWAPLGNTSDDEVTLLSPLDPVHARSRAKILFDFEYVWEIYKKAELVQFGRYTMPILWGDRLVGRLDPRLDRKTDTLVINGTWTESAREARDPAFGSALGLGVQRLMAFLGAERVDAAGVKSAALRRELLALNPKRRRS